MYRKQWLYVAFFCLATQVFGYTPSYDGNAQSFDPLEGVTGKKPSIKNPHSIAVSGSAGTMSYVYGIEGLPALLPGGISFVYSSSARFNRECAYGWSLAGVLEITKIRDPDYATSALHDEDKLYRLEGGLSGLIKYHAADGKYNLYDIGGKKVSISKTSSGWGIKDSSGLTWSLEEQPSGSEYWRATRCADLKGNYVDFNYDGSGRLTSLNYGGNDETGDGHNVTVELEYAAREHAYYSAQYGTLEKWDKYVSAVLVKADGWGSDDIVRRYDFETEEDGAVVLYKKMTVTGYDESGSAATGEPVEFDYNDYDEASDTDRDGETVLAKQDDSKSDGMWEVGSEAGMVHRTYVEDGYSWQDIGWADFNGDGLIDRVETDGFGQWKVWLQRVDEDTRKHSFADGADVTITDGPFTYMSEWDDGQQLVAFEDINNDGYPDLICTFYMSWMDEFDGYDDYSTYKGIAGDILDEAHAATVGDYLNSYSSTWGIWYGNGSGFDDPVIERAPYSWIRRQQDIGSDSTVKLEELMDVDGDGWKDVIRAVPHSTSVSVWYKNASKDGNWATSDDSLTAPWLKDLDSTYGGLSQGETDWHRGTSEEGPATPKFVTDVYTWGQFMDFNRDGWVDYVISNGGADYVGTASGYWTVYFGLPTGGWEEKVTIKGSSPWLDHREMYNASGDAGTYAGLFDVDGDGLLDSAKDGKWYRNLGDKIDTTAQDLPTRMNYRGMALLSETEIETETYYGNERAINTSTFDITDVDGDGIVDLLDNGYGQEVEYGPYPRAYTLKSVTRGSGLTTWVDYRAASSTYPRGQVDEDQSMNTMMDLVDYVQTFDDVTTDYLYTDHEYKYGRQERGVFLGFGEHTSEQQSWVDVPGATGYPLKWVKSVEQYDTSPALSYGGAVATNSMLYTDAWRRYAPYFDLSGGEDVEDLPLLVLQTTTAFGKTGTHYVASTVHTKERGEEWYYGDAKESEVKMVYDSNGFLDGAYVDGNADGFLFKADDLYTKIYYRTNSAGDVVRPRYVGTSGYDPLKSRWRQLSLEQYAYDSDMYVTQKQYSAGNYYTDSSIAKSNIYIKLTRNNRGNVAIVNRSQDGSTWQQISMATYEFGGTTPAISYDTNIKKSENTVNNRGQVTESEDPNGFVTKKQYDGLGRVTVESVVDLDGVEHITKRISYDTDEAPYYITERIYESDDSLQNVTTTFLNGSGKPHQVITKNDDGDSIVVDTYYNLFGELVYSSKPYAYTTGSAGDHRYTEGLQTVNYYDGLGRLHESWIDYDEEVGPNLTYYNYAGQIVQEDTEGYSKTMNHDNFGRLTNVVISGNCVGSYQYDGLGTLVEFCDANTNKTKYYYDGVGRLWKTDGTDVGKHYRSYSFANMTLSSNSAGDVVQITYDKLDRPVTNYFTDPVRGAVEYVWKYDSELYGKLDKATDPLGYETYAYDEFGRLKEETRVFEDFGEEPTFSYTYDLAGKLLTKTYPTGWVLSNHYENGYKTGISFSDGAYVGIDYNNFGKVTTMTNNLGMTWDYAYHDSEMFLKSIDMTTPEQHIGRAYSWYDNGLLKAKWHTLPTGGAIAGEGYLKYTYDAYQQLTKVQQNRSTGVGFDTYESFTYDLNGNLKKQVDTDGRTNTYTLGSGNQLKTKKQMGLAIANYKYDAVGRTTNIVGVAGSSTTYAYNSLSRMVDIKKNGTTVETYGYAADGNLVFISDGEYDSGKATLRFRDWEKEIDGTEETEESAATSGDSITLDSGSTSTSTGLGGTTGGTIGGGTIIK